MARIGRQAEKYKQRVVHKCVEMVVTCRRCGDNQCTVCGIADLEAGREMWDRRLCSECLMRVLVRRVRVLEKEKATEVGV